MENLAVFYYPTTQVSEGEYLALHIGPPTLEVGAVVTLQDKAYDLNVPDLHVVAVDTFTADDMPEGMLHILNTSSVEEFMAGLSNVQGYTLPDDIDITVYLFSENEGVVTMDAVYDNG